MNTMVIRWGAGESIIFRCNGCMPAPPKIDLAVEKTIPHFHSYQEAKEAGWMFTKCERFSPDGKMAAVCPDCVKDIC